MMKRQQIGEEGSQNAAVDLGFSLCAVCCQRQLDGLGEVEPGLNEEGTPG